MPPLRMPDHATIQPVTEREMSRLQRSLVDSSFEEGHYEAGIAVLDELLVQNYMPSRSHVRQLLYIALYPSVRRARNNHDAGAPSKTSSSKSNSDLTPSPSATVAAQRSLMLTASSYTPAALLRALPSHADRNDMARSGLPEAEDEAEEAVEYDSFIAGEAQRFQQCKDVWQILKQGFVPLVAEGPGIPPASPSKRRRGDAQAYHTLPHDDSPVSSDAWPILNWLLTLFERDEKDAQRRQHVLYSPLLLSQISPTRSETGARWDANAPLEVALYCLKQEEPFRQQMGKRLLTLLIDLTSTTLFDLPLFVNLLLAHLPSDPQELQNFFSTLPGTLAVMKFKLVLCQRYLSHAPAKTRRSTAKAQPRAQPRPAPRRRAGDSASSQPTARISSADITIASHHPTPPASEILHLFSPTANAGGAVQVVKYHLLLAYAKLQYCAATEEKSQDWARLLREGDVARAVEEAFVNSTDKESMRMKNGLLAMTA
ncbi:hypothetical protein FA95DRAFT_1602329 [Auriscalpium vulgare]|uniref:Uncharacterized protein n=1 Tax=Auriscalpium vulgare TaxID=40419 RepID=A0ACB8S7R0_9AGAM|nr:hypothetical protein FA95DRAFT_1602329 [Auriscalpium vulgare]